MNKTPRLSPTDIEYGDYAWNFASGCGNNIDGKCRGGGFNCWAYSISQRFENHYPNGFKATIYPEALCSPVYLKKPSRILCAFMGDFFWDCPEFDPDRKFHATMPSGKTSISMSLKGWIFTTIKQCPQHQFIFLTKQPQNLIKFSPFPDNCWVGVTATNQEQYDRAWAYLRRIKAKIKYISFEPLLNHISLRFRDFVYCKPEGYINRPVDWVIIGAQTKPTVMPKIEWVREIVEAADKAGIPVFLKDNLLELVNYDLPETAFAFNKIGYYRQEMPA